MKSFQNTTVYKNLSRYSKSECKGMTAELVLFLVVPTTYLWCEKKIDQFNLTPIAVLLYF